MKKLLIITYSFPPLNNIASRRFGELVPYLLQSGWEIEILTSNSNGTLPINIPEANIIRFGDHPQKSSVVDKELSHKKGNKLLDLKRMFGFNLRVFDRTYFKWYREIKKQDLLNNRSYDLILASYGPSASLYLGHYYAKKLNIPWVADFRDLGALYKDNNFKHNIIAKFIDKTIEKKLLSNVSAITSVGNVLSELIGDYYGKPTLSVFNGWGEYNTENLNLNTSGGHYIYYAGRFYPHQMKSIYKLINVLKKFPNISLVIRSLGPSYLNKELISHIKESNLSERISLLEPTNPHEVLIESENSYVNLVLEDLNEDIYWKKGTITGKLLGLLPLSPPILTIAREDSEIGEILNLTNKGKVCSNETDIYKYLSTINKQMYKGNEEVHFYSKRNQAKRLSELLDEFI